MGRKISRAYKAQWCKPGEDPDEMVRVLIISGEEHRWEKRPRWEVNAEIICEAMERDDLFRRYGR